MTSTNDDQRPNTGVSGCLDVQVVRDELNAAVEWPGSWRVKDVLIRRFTPRPEQRFHVEYEVALQDSQGCESPAVSLFGRCPPLQDPAVDQGRSPSLAAGTVSGLFVHSAPLNASIHSMDRDPDFPQFLRCMDASFMASRIGAFDSTDRSGQESPSVSSLRCIPLSFRCGRRFVVRYDEQTDGEKPRAWAGKCYADNRGRKLTKRHRVIAKHLASHGDGSVSLPRLVRYDPELRMVLSEWERPSSAIECSRVAEILPDRAAQVLVALHAAPQDHLRMASGQRYWQTLERWCDLLVTLRPRFGNLATEHLVALADVRQDDVSSPRVVTHGDFYETQLICGEHGTTLLDLDTLALGDRCMDLGNCLAHHWHWCLQHQMGIACCANMVRATLQSYESRAGALDEAALGYYWAATLFRIGAIHAFRDATSHTLSKLWAMIGPVLQQGRNAFDSVGHVEL